MTSTSTWSAWWPPSWDHTPTWKELAHVWHQRARKGSRRSRKSIVVFTDPDGTLLERRSRPCVPACEALDFLADHDVPIVLCSSRTRAELELIQQEFRLRHPFISENGGAVHLPRGYFSSSSPSSAPLDQAGYDVLALGAPHERVVEVLRHTAETTRIEVRGFNDMSVQDVAAECGLSLAEARLAQLREYDEPFRILESDPAVHNRLFAALRRAGLRSVKGSGRFHHVTAGGGIALAVRTLKALYRQHSGDVLSVGVCDGLADPSLLREVDLPIIVWNAEADVARVLRKIPTARVTTMAGSLGWNEAIFSAVEPELQKVSGPR